MTTTPQAAAPIHDSQPGGPNAALLAGFVCTVACWVNSADYGSIDGLKEFLVRNEAFIRKLEERYPNATCKEHIEAALISFDAIAHDSHVA